MFIDQQTVCSRKEYWAIPRLPFSGPGLRQSPALLKQDFSFGIPNHISIPPPGLFAAAILYFSTPSQLLAALYRQPTATIETG